MANSGLFINNQEQAGVCIGCLCEKGHELFRGTEVLVELRSFGGGGDGDLFSEQLNLKLFMPLALQVWWFSLMTVKVAFCPIIRECKEGISGKTHLHIGVW